MSAISERIATGLRTGFPHPTEPDKKPPILLPGFRTAGMNPDMAGAVDDATELLASAIVASIESDYELVPRSEMVELRQAGEAPAAVVTVYCRCDTGRRDPLMTLRVRGSHAVVDGSKVIPALTQRSVSCPHV
jgi:hypothetical protein